MHANPVTTRGTLGNSRGKPEWAGLNSGIDETRGKARPDLWWFAVVIAALNLPMLLGESGEELAFLPAAVAAGEWWRVLTHAFVHVSWYHLLLDAGAFLMLYATLDAPRWWTRVGYTAASAAGSLAVCWLLDPRIRELGFCGLSGTAHGLMAVTALEMANRPGNGDSRRWIGALCFIAVAGKSLIESWSNGACFPWLHFGLMGTPLLSSHLGGVLGGVAAFILARSMNRRETTHEH